MKRYSTLMAAAVLSTALYAQENPLATEVKGAYTNVKNNLIKAAEKMPEENYSFKPVPEVQSFAQRVAHIADSNARNCGAIKSEQKNIGAASKTSKADLVAAIKESFAYCDTVFDAATDADITKMVTMGQRQRSKIALLWGTVSHSNEIYGTMGVYMRLKGLVPPSSEPRN
jgi:uncharacterized damage-inducible protein DinB